MTIEKPFIIIATRLRTKQIDKKTAIQQIATLLTKQQDIPSLVLELSNTLVSHKEYGDQTQSLEGVIHQLQKELTERQQSAVAQSTSEKARHQQEIKQLQDKYEQTIKELRHTLGVYQQRMLQIINLASA